MILGARVSHPDPRINVGFREGTVIGSGEGMDDAVRLVYSGGAASLEGGREPGAAKRRVQELPVQWVTATQWLQLSYCNINSTVS